MSKYCEGVPNPITEIEIVDIKDAKDTNGLATKRSESTQDANDRGDLITKRSAGAMRVKNANLTKDFVPRSAVSKSAKSVNDIKHVPLDEH